MFYPYIIYLLSISLFNFLLGDIVARWKIDLLMEFTFILAEIYGGYRARKSIEEDPNAAHAQALADMKFTYVVSCQIYGAQKKSDEQRERNCYRDILNLMLQ